MQLSVLDPRVAELSPQGLLTLKANGATALVAQRAGVAAATVVGVGEPTDAAGLITYYYGIDAYPDSVTLLPEGGTRQTIVKRGTSASVFVTQASDGTRYFSGNTGVASVSADGLITAAAQGDTWVTVINGFAEDRVQVKVQPPLSSTGMAVVGAQGGIVANADGVTVAIGQGQLQGNATITVTSVAESALALPTPPQPARRRRTFKFLAAFDLGVEGGELTGPLQVAVPVQGPYTAGEQVFFFQKMRLPIGPNGEEGDVWAVVGFRRHRCRRRGPCRLAAVPGPEQPRLGADCQGRAAGGHRHHRRRLPHRHRGGLSAPPWAWPRPAAASWAAVGFSAIAGGILSLAALAFIGQKVEIQLWAASGAPTRPATT